MISTILYEASNALTSGYMSQREVSIWVTIREQIVSCPDVISIWLKWNMICTILYEASNVQTNGYMSQMQI